MLRLISSIVGGLVLAFAIVFLFDMLFHALVPTAAKPQSDDAAAMRDYVARQPVSALILLLVGWAVAVFAGAAAAARFARRGTWPGWIVTALFLLATAANFVMVSHPVWMVAAGIAMIIAAGWLGARTGARRTA